MPASEPPPSLEVVHYGPDIPGEDELRLLGSVGDKRLLVLGCHSPRSCVALAQQGAKVIVYDPSADRLAKGREACERAEVKAEFRHLDLADLALLQADSIDLALSVYTIGEVQDLDRVLRQIHRVLSPGAALVLSVPHPAFAMLDRSSGEPVRLSRPYLDTAPPPPPSDPGMPETPRPVGESTHVPSALVASLGRAKFRVDTLLEPEPLASGPRSRQWTEVMRWVPPTLILRARKEGV